MAKFTNIPDEHHFVRHVEAGRVQRDDAGAVIGLFPEAMSLRMLKNGPEKELSGCYLEYFGEDLVAGVSQACKVLKARLAARFTDADVVAVMNAKLIRDIGGRYDNPLRVLHTPKPKTEDKASLTGLPVPPGRNAELELSLAALALSQIHAYPPEVGSDVSKIDKQEKLGSDNSDEPNP